MKDRRLARRAQSGDRAAFGQLVREHQDKVFTLALRMTGRRDQAEDMSQAAFIRAWEQLARYDASRPFRPWLFRVAANTVRNALKSQRSGVNECQPETTLDSKAGDGPGPEELTARAQEHELLAAALQNLKPKLREAVVLRFYVDLEFEEIAQVLSISLSSAKMRVYRGLDALRATYERNKT